MRNDKKYLHSPPVLRSCSLPPQQLSSPSCCRTSSAVPSQHPTRPHNHSLCCRTESTTVPPPSITHSQNPYRSHPTPPPQNRLRFHNHRSPNSRRQVSLPLTSGSDYTESTLFHSPSVTATPRLWSSTWTPAATLPGSLAHPWNAFSVKASLQPPLSPAQPISPPPSHATSVSCSAAHSSLSSSDLCAIAGCPLDTIETSTCSAFPCPPFYYTYGGDCLIACLRRDHLSMSAGSGTPLHLPNFTFGCAHTTLAEPVEVAGFGRGILSLPSQLTKLFPHLGKQFSYCLISHSFESQRLHLPSPLILGRTTLDNSDPFIYTPMLDNSKHPYFYSVGLEAISVGGTHLPALPSLARVDHAGNGGFVVDSGTTFTMLPDDIYNHVILEFDRRMKAAEAESETGLGPCYYSNSSGSEASSLVEGRRERVWRGRLRRE